VALSEDSYLLVASPRMRSFNQKIVSLSRNLSSRQKQKEI